MLLFVLGIGLVLGLGIGRLLRPGAPPAAPAAAPGPVAAAPAAAPPPVPTDTGRPLLPALDQDPFPVSHISPRGVATLTLPPGLTEVQRRPDGLTVHPSPGTRHPVATLRLLLVEAPTPSRSRMVTIATSALTELDGVLGPPGTVRRGLREGLDAPFTGTVLGAPVHGRVQVLPLEAELTAVLMGWGPTVAAAHDTELTTAFNSLAWAPNLAEATAAPTPCEPPAPSRAVTAVDAAETVARLEALAGCVVVVEIWSTDCPVCRAPHDALQALAGPLQGEGLALLQLSLDDEPAALPRFLDRERLLSPPLRLTQDARATLGATLARRGLQWPGTRPWFAVLDREGAVVHQGSSPPSESALRRAL